MTHRDLDRFSVLWLDLYPTTIELDSGFIWKRSTGPDNLTSRLLEER